jgi:L-fuculose-phosphate aldolase
MSDTLDARRQIVLICRRLYERGHIAGPDGNVSVRLASDVVLSTPAGMSKVDVTEEDLVEVSLAGDPLRGPRAVSSEIRVHLRLYRRRPDVMAVVHAHPPMATAFAVAGESLDLPVLPEIIWQVGWVPLVPYAMPGTEALADRLEPFIARHDAFLLANHGALTAGPSLTVAHQRMESLEHTARILFTARLLGRVRTLAPEDVRALVEARRRAFPDEVYPGCPVADGGWSDA